MASGAVPGLLSWQGADEIHDRRWIHDSPEARAEGIASLAGHGPAEAGSTAGPGRWREAGAVARDQAREAGTPEREAEEFRAVPVG